MNDRNAKREKLLAETFHNDWETGPAAHLARIAATAARRRHALRQSSRAAGALAFVGAVVFVVLQKTPPPPVPSASTKTATAPRGYEILTDEELLSAVRDRPLLALTREDGSRQIIVLPGGAD